MKHLLTAIACFFALSISAQTPYNPDVDGDDCITVTDVLSIPGLFNTCEEGYMFYYLKAGGDTYPFSDLIGEGNMYLIGDSTYTPYTYAEGGLDIVMEDLINNADGQVLLLKLAHSFLQDLLMDCRDVIQHGHMMKVLAGII